jgi:CheY-like chemotaxis protein
VHLVPAEPAARADGGGPPVHRRVLVADDNHDAANTLAQMLRLQGHDVRVAHDGQVALALAETFQPDVALLDIGMPVVDGYEVARRLRAQRRGRLLLLVAITGWGQDEDRRKSHEAGFHQHLTKPVDPSLVEALIRAL